MLKLPLGDFIEHIAGACQEDTSSDPGGWTPQNPTWGHCAVVALLTQELYGGDVWRSSLVQNKQFAFMRSHYGNKLPSGAMLDLTAPQFGMIYPIMEPQRSSREYILSYPATLARYEIFQERYEDIARVISSRNKSKDQRK